MPHLNTQSNASRLSRFLKCKLKKNDRRRLCNMPKSGIPGSKQEAGRSQVAEYNIRAYLRPYLSNIVAFSTAFVALGAGFLVKQYQQLHQALDDMIPEVMKRDKVNFILINNNHDPEPVEEKQKNLSNELTVHFRNYNAKELLSKLREQSHDLKTIIRLTRAENPKTRKLAVEALGYIKSWPWTDAEYRMIAQALDYRAVIALAHIGHADPRYFLPPPPVPPSDLSLEQQFSVLLSALPMRDLDKCATYFVETALNLLKTTTKKNNASADRDLIWSQEFGGSEYLVASHPVEQSSSVLYMRFLQALLGHSKLASHCVEMVHNKGLVVLRRVCEVEREHKQILHTVGKILANLTFQEELHDDIARAGWVTIFADWMKGDDLTLKLQASKALTNLDSEQERLGKFQDGVYLYHPQQRSSSHAYADIVFVHGLLGGPAFTWRQKEKDKPQQKINQGVKPGNGAAPLGGSNDTSHQQEPSVQESDNESECWPKDWLANDCPNTRILSIEYDTHLSDWAPMCPYDKEKRTLYARSTEFLEKLQEAGIGERPIIWVGHSMGGLIIKKMLLLAQENPAIKNIVDKTKGIVFYSVPHRGNDLAQISKQTKYLLFPSTEVTELAKNSPHLLDLQKHFKELIYQNKIPLLSFGETLPLRLYSVTQVIMVPQESSDPGIGQFELMHDTNHLTICKPASKDSPLYRTTLGFIYKCLPYLAIGNVLDINLLDENILPEETNTEEASAGS